MLISALDLRENFLREFVIETEKLNWKVQFAKKVELVSRADYIVIDTIDSRIIKRIREISNRPIIVLGKDIIEFDKSLLFQAGIDIYMDYPSPQELIWQLQALINMEDRVVKEPEKKINIGDFEFDLITGDIKLFNRPLNFTKTEREIFLKIINNAGGVVSREELSNKGSRSVDVHIRRIRQKLGEIANREYIITARNRGYYFNSGEL